MSIKTNLQQVRQLIIDAALQFNCDPKTIKLLAVSKTRNCAEIMEAYTHGQQAFGENYVQEALPKITQLHHQPLEWHFIGPIQSNKAKAIAQNFAWVHSIERYKIAQRLSEYRPENLEPLNVCIQVNLNQEASKSGVSLPELASLVMAILPLPRIKLRGLMTIPAVIDDFQQQRDHFSLIKAAQDQLNRQLDLNLDTLSMGMSGDFVAAIAEGATIIRVGTAIFGSRKK